MPGSNMSRISTMSVNDRRARDRAANTARQLAEREIVRKIQSGLLDKNDTSSIRREYEHIFEREYYKYFALNPRQQQVSIVYTENPSARRYLNRHTVVNFSRLNCLVHVHRDRITVGRFDYPIQGDISPETKEARLPAWPGPLDKCDDNMGRKIVDYIATLLQHDSQRRIKYSIPQNDDHRKIILKLLTELINRNGTIDALGVVPLLLDANKTEIQKDEGLKEPLEPLKKYLLLGKRSEAIQFAESKKLWDHAICLAFLDKYQPPKTANYIRDSVRLKDDSIVQLLDRRISSVDNQILNTVYRSLFNRILISDPDSVNIVHHPNVENDPYLFAILSANDCKMDYDHSNEIFNLISAVKQIAIDQRSASRHIISLGNTYVDNYDTIDDTSYLSHTSFDRQDDIYASRTSTISNIDMLILNEVWEYCLNLAKGTCNPTDYEYIIDLVPYKLIFATKLLDFGLHNMFYEYLCSIRNALTKARNEPYSERDSFYDWTAIENCVEYYSRIWDIFCMDTQPQLQQSGIVQESMAIQPNLATFDYNTTYQAPNVNLNSYYPEQVANNGLAASYQNDDYPLSLPYQPENPFSPSVPQSTKQNIPQQAMFYQGQAQEEVTDFNPEPSPPHFEDKSLPYESHRSYNDYSNEPSRRPSMSQQQQPQPPQYYQPQQQQRSMDANVFSPPVATQPNSSMYDRATKPPMTSSSPVDKIGREKVPGNPPGESFTSPYSPINENDDLPRPDTDFSPRGSIVNNNFAQNQPQQQHQNQQREVSQGASNASNNNNNNSNNKSQPVGDQQQASFLSNLFGSAKTLLPKSNSKQMILPEDSKKSIIFDHERNTWVDTTEPEGQESVDANDAPPVMNVPTPPNYSFAKKATTGKRYPPPTLG